MTKKEEKRIEKGRQRYAKEIAASSEEEGKWMA
jgi:hypothetical protein